MQEITISEIKRLNRIFPVETIYNSSWYVTQIHPSVPLDPYGYDVCYNIEVCSLESGVPCISHQSMSIASHLTEEIAKLLSASPRIAAKAIALDATLTALNQNMESMQQTNEALLKRLAKQDAVNKEIIITLEYAMKQLIGFNLNHISICVIEEVLTKAGAL